MSPPFQRVVLIVLDGVGIGALPDAAAYGDAGADTLGHLAAASGGLSLPNFAALGLGNLRDLPGMAAADEPQACFGRLGELSCGKDSTTGHWELAGVIQPEPFPTFPAGFPAEIIDRFVAETGLRPLGNKAASGTEIIRDLGEEHLRSGRPIVYTSVDSVFQIAAHEEVIPLDELYRICRCARAILNPYRVARVIARPFVGRSADDFRRTPHRHDFSLPPTEPTLLDLLKNKGLEVIGVGKIHDLFAGRGLTRHAETENNRQGLSRTLELLEELQQGLLMVNLVDFDMLYGHRRDFRGFAEALGEVDAWLPALQARLRSGDLLLITADHGCDPCFPGTDHTREYVPLLAWHKGLSQGRDLGTREGFADVAATVAEVFGERLPAGCSFLKELHEGEE